MPLPSTGLHLRKPEVFRLIRLHSGPRSSRAMSYSRKQKKKKHVKSQDSEVKRWTRVSSEMSRVFTGARSCRCR